MDVLYSLAYPYSLPDTAYYLSEVETKLTEDVVNQPPHYGNGEIECIDYMKDNMDHMMFMGYLEGNAKKYMHRYRYKGKPVEDLRKARWYLDRLISEMEGEQ